MVKVANEFSSLHLLYVKVDISRLLSDIRHIILRTTYDFALQIENNAHFDHE